MSTASPNPLSPGQESDRSSATGFRSYFKSGSSSAASPQNNVTFVQQDPASSGKKKASRLSRLIGRGSEKKSPSVAAGSPGDGATDAQKRRQQVYQAQKRHRNRKAEYVHNLEAEIAKLQQMDAQAQVEKNTLAHQNQAMKELLASHSLDFNLSTMNIAHDAHSDHLSSLGSASIEVREDSQIGGKERTFLDFAEDEMIWSAESSAVSPVGIPQEPKTSSIRGDSWAAVDFILALEFPCQDHLPHHGINPTAKAMLMETEDSSGFTGHQLCMTSLVYDAAQGPGIGQGQQHLHPHSQTPGHQHVQELKWQLPHTEIDKLVRMSEQLPMDEEEMTPAQAYSAIKNSVPSEDLLRPALDNMKLPLSGIVECRGFGTVMPTDLFRQYLHTTLEIIASRS